MFNTYTVETLDAYGYWVSTCLETFLTEDDAREQARRDDLRTFRILRNGLETVQVVR